MTCVVMLVTTNFTYDSRVQKEAKSLTQDGGYDVTVFALRKGDSPLIERRDDYRVERIRLISKSWGKHLVIRLLKYLEFCIRAIRLVVNLDPAIVHAHDVDTLIPGYITARLCGARLVYDSHELWAVRTHNVIRYPWLRNLVTAVEGYLARQADLVITVSHTIADYLAQAYHIPKPLVLMNTHAYQPPQPSDLLHQELDIPSNQRIVIYAGLMKLGRGLEVLVEAAAYLDNAVVVLMGENRIEKKLNQLIATHEVKRCVILHEPVPPDEVHRYISAADIGVVPTQNIDLSYYYAAENKLFHYLMAGIPAAVSDHPEKRSIVETHDVGIVFDETDPRAVAQTINALLNDESTYEATCERAREISRTTLNWDIEAKALLSAYDDLSSTSTST
jgi:glycosyltransferase involved in cell wall biosynthesis